MKRILYYLAPIFIVGILYAWNTTAPYIDPADVTAKSNTASPTFTGTVGIPKISSGSAPSAVGRIGYDYVGSVATLYISTSTEALGWK